MQLKNHINFFDRLPSYTRQSFVILYLIACAVLLSSCGKSDAEFLIKNFCSQVKTGESIMDVVSRAGTVEFDKYWLEKFNKKPPEGKIIGVIRPRDLDKKTEKLKKLKSPKKWSHGQFNAMVQGFGYSRHVCSVQFARDKVLGKKVSAVD